ncbi:hypothetical protein FHS27_001877 [Rhodopirellula rubra]|uniref:Uncharacterized protein n=1 Tax=Aporhodopirellula rubra TaxID=980271 RepID=A0A7W5DWX9_9BACT|nr:hypothetical protein [Aporhodopirellula rubra]MBB3206069.1 hypothetical protein [Aporhodopirellula rubra]
MIRYLLPFLVIAPAFVYAEPPFRIEIVDAENGWPVPLVQLETNHHVRFVSDNAGVIAFDLPELMNTETWFSISGHGYGVKPDGFGYMGVRLTPQPGKSHVIEVKRQLPAQRLGRVTGTGLFAESQKCGEHLDWTDQNILGCDSVQNATWGDRKFWLWGDTTLAGYPLGRYHTTGATTSPRPFLKLVPPIELRYNYFTDPQNIPRNIAQMPGQGPTWLFGLVNLTDRHGRERLGATYSKIEGMLTEYEKGLCSWNQELQQFEHFKTIWTKDAEHPLAPLMPHGHAIHYTDPDHQNWILFGAPFPRLRCRATFEDWASPGKWETIDANNAVEVHGSKQTITPHRGTIAWNEYRNKWITIFTQKGGRPSELGEIWYAEAESPFGPWRNAIPIVTHDNYTFYNPQIHSDMVTKGSPVLLFEGTFTATFAKNATKTPRYDYNQILYRLDLDKPPFSKTDL